MALDLGSAALTDGSPGVAAHAPPLKHLSIRISAVYAAIYLHYGAFGLFLPLWFAHRGMTPEQIGTLMALPMLLRIVFVAPVTSLADRLRRIREVLLVCVVGAILLMACLNFAVTYWHLLIFFTVFALVWDPLPILADSYAVLAVRSRGLDFGRMRLWGSLAFVAANVACGRLIEVHTVDVVPWLTALLLAIPIIPILLLPPDRLLGAPQKAERGEWRAILRDRAVVIAMLATALISASHVVLNTFGAIQWSGEGISGTMIGALVATAIAGEIVVMFFVQRLLGARSPLWLIAIGGAAAVVRWLCAAASPPLAALFGLMLLNGLTGMGAITGLMLFIGQRVEGRLIATAQGINAVVLGVLAAIATAASGYAWRALGTDAYLAMAAVAALGCAMALGGLARGKA
jgi:MFS transporter, PPP family, 3-phenylpropionic acid transporter